MNFGRLTRTLSQNSEETTTINSAEELFPENQDPNSFKMNRRISNVFANLRKPKKLISQESIDENKSSSKKSLDLDELLKSWKKNQNEKRLDEYFQREHKVSEFLYTNFVIYGSNIFKFSFKKIKNPSYLKFNDARLECNNAK